MRGHHDQIASFHLRCIDNGLKRMCVLDVEGIAIYARFRGIPHLFEVLCCDGRHSFLYDSDVFVTAARTWNGGETVTPVTLALTAFAKDIPYCMAPLDRFRAISGNKNMLVHITFPFQWQPGIRLRCISWASDKRAAARD